MRTIAGLASGLIFGIGLIVSGMSDPAKVLNFLDIAGSWDPSLAFVMGGAVAVTFIGYRLVQLRTSPLLAERFHVPDARRIDLPLLAGAAVFGTGWGLSGFCPGPALTSFMLFAQGTLAFVPAMLIGMVAGRLFKDRMGTRAARLTRKTT